MAHGEFMDLLPLNEEGLRSVPATAGCYIIYLDGSPFYVGRSRVDLRRRLVAHARGRGSRAVRELPSKQRQRLKFEYCDVRESDGVVTPEDIAGTEFFFMAMFTGNRPRGNLRWDG